MSKRMFRGDCRGKGCGEKAVGKKMGGVCVTVGKGMQEGVRGIGMWGGD